MKIKRSVKKIVSILVTCALISALLCLPVSADGSYEALPITVTKVWTNAVEDNSYTKWDENYYCIDIPYSSYKSEFASLWTVNNDDTENYYSYKFKFVFNAMEPYDFTLSFNGVTYEVQIMVVDEWETYYYVDIHDIKLKNPNSRLDFDFNWSSTVGSTGGSIYFQAFYQYSDLNVVVDNQNENTDKIIENQNSNTQSQIDNDNAIKDEILYGAEFDDSTASDESFGNYDKVESDLIDGTQSNAEVATQEVNDNFLGSIQRMGSGLSAVAGMFTDMLITKIPDLNIIVWFSLAMGVVPLLVGLSVQGLRSRDAAAARARSQNDYKRGYNAGYTKGKGG